MSLTPLSRLRAVCLGVIAVCASTAALASLGGDADSVNADSHQLRGNVAATSLVQYDVQQIASGSLVVNEYLTRAGQVFAITWQGPTPPNMQQLLGSYFGRFQAATQAAHQNRPGIHRQFTLSQPDLVIQSSGRLRAFRGIAYLPALIPDGVSVDNLQ